MSKEFLPYSMVRNDALKLAKRIFDDGFMPDVIYIPLRGGAYMGNVFSEFFKLVNTRDRPVFYAAVVARSYTDIHQAGRVRIDGWTYDPEYLRSGDKVLFVDDIFDTGRTINHLVECILDKGLPREDVKIAVHDFKVASYREQMPITPDYWWRKLVVDKPENDSWIHYLSHELEGLTDLEIEEQYLATDPDLAEVFDLIRKSRVN
ncbi:MAG: phosphoribosyltransferase [Spirochaetes bacterium]|nr:MAG: phosphoribosyltransferase [Spirochaetota bacterium]RKX84379.1 MAG: phosphoribosyltransferase [Spirochaetota bacterium]RKX96420.1 MAG: phosphoribosyltransferase [Spirochaetota bacterium]